MNNSKPVTVTPRHQPFQLLEIALQAAGTAILLVDAVPAKFRSLQDQIIRSASSVPSNIAEGNGRRGRDRAHFFRIALGSAREVDVQLRLLSTIGIIGPAETREALELFDRVRAMLWKLVHR